MATFVMAMLVYVRTFLAARRRNGNGDNRSSTATRRLQKEAAGSQAESIRPAVLGSGSARLEQLVRSSRSRQARHGSLVAYRRLPTVLEMAISPAPSRMPEGG